MIDVNRLVRENVRSLVPYSCARDEFMGSEGIFMDANENPFGNLNRYPDPYQRELKSAISKIKGIEDAKIFLGNGSDEIIDLIFRIFCNPGTDKALIFTPTYGMYEVSAAINDVAVIKIPLDENFQLRVNDIEQVLSDKSLKLIFFCSPNNPTGNCMSSAAIEEIISGFKGIAVIDEAYIDFTDNHSLIKLIDKYSNLIVMQTFSKAMGLAAIRIGIAYTNPLIIGYFNKMKPPYNISSINQRTALKKLGKIGESRVQVAKIKKERERLSEELSRLSLTEKVYPSDANFLLVKVKDADMIYKTLIDDGIVVRNRSSVVKNCLRITVGKRDENNKLLSALNKIEI
jgi:histidinol-phosphate aminotransferase